MRPDGPVMQGKDAVCYPPQSTLSSDEQIQFYNDQIKPQG